MLWLSKETEEEIMDDTRRANSDLSPESEVMDGQAVSGPY